MVYHIDDEFRKTELHGHLFVLLYSKTAMLELMNLLNSTSDGQPIRCILVCILIVHSITMFAYPMLVFS
jgi:hypothetical protein